MAIVVILCGLILLGMIGYAIWTTLLGTQIQKIRIMIDGEMAVNKVESVI